MKPTFQSLSYFLGMVTYLSLILPTQAQEPLITPSSQNQFYASPTISIFSSNGVNSTFPFEGGTTKQMTIYPFRDSVQLISIYESHENPAWYRHDHTMSSLPPPSAFYYHNFVLRHQSGEILKVYGTGTFQKEDLDSISIDKYGHHWIKDQQLELSEIQYLGAVSYLSHGDEIKGYNDELRRKQAHLLVTVEDLSWLKSKGNINYNKKAQWGILDTLGNTALPFEYDYIVVDRGYLYLYKNGMAEIRDFQLKLLRPAFDLQQEYHRPWTDSIFISKSPHKAYQYVLTDSYGDLVLDSSVHVSVNFNELDDLDRLVIFKVDEKNKHYYGLVANDGQLIIPCKYTDLKYREDQLSLAWIGDKYGFINREGQEVIPVQFEQATLAPHLKNPIGFIGNYASVSKNGKWGVIDTLGKVIIPFEHDFPLSIRLFGNSKKTDPVPFFYSRGEKEKNQRTFYVFGLIDSANQTILNEEYATIMPFFLENKQYFLAQKRDGERGFLDPKGK